jgi:PTS system fructose-specific IIA component/PTS system nitrogen regulatory IIA component
MAMTDFVVRDAINPSLAAGTKDGVIREIVDSLRSTGNVAGDVADDIVRAILKREQLGSTGIGRGIAIPHTKHASVDRLTGTVAISRGGVAFDSIDGEPVYVFVLLVSPQDRPGDHLRALENVVRTMRDDAFVKALRQADSKEAVWKLLTDSSAQWDR